MSGTLCSVVWFLGPVSIKKTGQALAFFFFLRLIEIAAKLLPSFLKKILDVDMDLNINTNTKQTVHIWIRIPYPFNFVIISK